MSSDVTVRMRPYAKEKQTCRRCTVDSVFHRAGETKVVSARHAKKVLAMEAADGKPLFEEPKPEPVKKAPQAQPEKKPDEKKGKGKK